MLYLCLESLQSGAQQAQQQHVGGADTTCALSRARRPAPLEQPLQTGGPSTARATAARHQRSSDTAAPVRPRHAARKEQTGPPVAARRAPAAHPKSATLTAGQPEKKSPSTSRLSGFTSKCTTCVRRAQKQYSAFQLQVCAACVSLSAAARLPCSSPPAAPTRAARPPARPPSACAGRPCRAQRAAPAPRAAAAG